MNKDPTQGLKYYLVGGAVRDELLGRIAADRDWVVVGATVAEMRQRGFRPVGTDFPVFLHPATHEEYALARSERKTSPGYRGFQVDSSPDVTLEQDLSRRDLTINAIAQHPEGELIDPFGGVNDIKSKVLRHVSPAFSEDPVRVLRVARFAARYASIGFKIAPETLELMRQISKSGEIDALIAERVWNETERALGEPSPQVYISVLRECAALQRILPEIDALFGVPQPERHHPEIDAGVHTLMVLEQAARLTNDKQIRFAALLHDLGKALTPPAEWPRHKQHEQRGVKPVENLCERLRAPKAYRQLALLVCRYHLLMSRLDELRPQTILHLLENIDAFRRPERVDQYAIACEADSRGRKGLQNRPYPQRELLNKYFTAARKVSVTDISDRGFSGRKIGKLIETRRVEAIKVIKTSLSKPDQ